MKTYCVELGLANTQEFAIDFKGIHIAAIGGEWTDFGYHRNLYVWFKSNRTKRESAEKVFISNLPVKRIKRFLVASRMQTLLSMREIETITKALMDKKK